MDGAGSKPGVPLAASLGLLLKSLDDFIDGVPHDEATFVHIPVGVPNNLDAGIEHKPIQNLTTGLSH